MANHFKPDLGHCVLKYKQQNYKALIQDLLSQFIPVTESVSESHSEPLAHKVCFTDDGKRKLDTDTISITIGEHTR